ncbi:HAD-IIIA family hydrolase [Streptomyces sp. NPDC008121]|uniref:HAD-IIIA family hydrolase n=1 Tax=Streptomyces sp. NPDC008121 TaxID=3364809 RepID=UPI0036E31697
MDVPYNGDPALVTPMAGAVEAVAALRSLGIAVGVVSNQSGLARGLITRPDVEAVRRRVDALLGPFAVWAVCPHGPDDGCACRKPEPGLVLAACARLGVPPARTVVIGDIAADTEAARAAGARGVLVPTPVTLPTEIETAAETAPDLRTAVRRLLTGTGADLPAATRRLLGEGATAEAGVAPPAAERRPLADDAEAEAPTVHTPFAGAMPVAGPDDFPPHAPAHAAPQAPARPPAPGGRSHPEGARGRDPGPRPRGSGGGHPSPPGGGR